MMQKLLSILFLVLVLSLIALAQEKAINSANSEKSTRDLLAEDLKYLSSDELKGRETGTPESKVARDFIARRFKESGVIAFETGYFQNFSFESRTKLLIEGANVVGFIKGSKLPNKYIVVSAHYDHLGIRGENIYNGADDNASGTAALFAIARYFRKCQPEHSLIFAAFDAEEKGSPGAREFLKKPPVDVSSIVLNVNLDMIARGDKNELYISGTYHYPNLKPLVEPLVKDAPIKLLFGHDSPESKRDDWTPQSDHRVFHEAKIPFLYFGVEDHPDYHKPTDDFEKVDIDFYANAVEMIKKAIVAVDKGFGQDKSKIK